jgi:hypothetical protein
MFKLGIYTVLSAVATIPCPPITAELAILFAVLPVEAIIAVLVEPLIVFTLPAIVVELLLFTSELVEDIILTLLPFAVLVSLPIITAW